MDNLIKALAATVLGMFVIASALLVMGCVQNSQMQANDAAKSVAVAEAEIVEVRA